jgi:DNA-binding NarL/FixJ family response regulator
MRGCLLVRLAEGEGRGDNMKLLIADDHRLILQALRRALAAHDDIEIVAEAHRGSHVLPLVNQTNPDVCLLDVRMPEMDGLTCIERLRKQHPDVRTVVLSAFSDRARVDEALDRGADAYVAKSIDPSVLADLLRRVHAGESFDAGLEETAPSAGQRAGLTDREAEILAALAQGLSNQAISAKLWITEQTVKFHLTNIYRKLDVANRTEAARFAFANGLGDLPD